MRHRLYIKTSLIQQTLEEHFPDKKMDIYSIYSYYAESRSESEVLSTELSPSVSALTDEQFEKMLLDVPCVVINPELLVKNNSMEELSLFDQCQISNIYIYRYMNYYKDIMHSHNFFEMFYVFRGTCNFYFQDKKVSLQEGDFLIIAPGTIHFMESDEDNFILNLSLRKSDFEAVFQAEMAVDNSLSLFFRNIFSDKAAQGYLLFHTGDDPDLKYCLKNITRESMLHDAYNFRMENCWLSIFFCNLVRNYSLNMEMEPPVYGSRCSHILQYINQNYQHVTLDVLSRKFHYTKPYLCALLKENTGYTFVQLVNRQRIHTAAKLLGEGTYTVAEIARFVGYASTDHFSRTFKKIYGVSPSFYKVKMTDHENDVLMKCDI
jgi:AraC-like DNA-binding protein